MPAADRADEWYRRIAREFAECPGLRLTPAQAARLWMLEPDRAAALLAALAEDHVLLRTATGAFVCARPCPRP